MPTALGALQPLDVVEMWVSPQSRDDGPSLQRQNPPCRVRRRWGKAMRMRLLQAGHINTSPRDQGGSRACATVWRRNASWVRAMPSSSRARMASIAQYVWGLS